MATSTIGGSWQATGCAPFPLAGLLLQAEPGFVFHHANAYVEGGRITVDCVRYPRLPDFKGCRSDGHTFVQVSAHPLHCSAKQDCHVTLRLRWAGSPRQWPPPFCPEGGPPCSRLDSSSI